MMSCAIDRFVYLYHIAKSNLDLQITHSCGHSYCTASRATSADQPLIVTATSPTPTTSLMSPWITYWPMTTDKVGRPTHNYSI